LSPAEAPAIAGAGDSATEPVAGNSPAKDTQVLIAAAPVRKDSLTALTAVEVQKLDLGDTGVRDKKEADPDKIAARSVSKAAAPEQEQQAGKIAAANTGEDLNVKPPAQLSDFETGVDLYKKKQYASALLYLKAAASDESNPRHWDAV